MAALLWLSLRNLARQKWLALILALSISIPLMSYLVLNAIQSEMNRRYNHLSQAFLVVEQGGSFGEFYGSRLPMQTGQLLRARGASLVEPEIRTITGTSGQDAILLRGIPLETYRTVESFQLTAGRALAAGDPPRSVMVGERLAQERGVYPGTVLSIRGRDFQVQALFSTGTYSDYEAWISLSDAQQLLGWEEDVSIFVIPAGETLQAGDLLPDGMTVIRKGEGGTNLIAEFRQLFDLLHLLAITLGVAAAANLAIALWRLAWQQRRDLAILQSVGFSRRSLALYLGGQSAAVTLGGFVLGVGEGALFTAYTRLQSTGISVQPSLDAATILLCLGYALAVYLLSTFAPVAWLARLNLAGLLRAE